MIKSQNENETNNRYWKDYPYIKSISVTQKERFWVVVKNIQYI